MIWQTKTNRPTTCRVKTTIPKIAEMHQEKILLKILQRILQKTATKMTTKTAQKIVANLQIIYRSLPKQMVSAELRTVVGENHITFYEL